jgi:hypothetical protein
MLDAKQVHPVVAVGNPRTPVLVPVPVPTVTVKAAVPLLAEMESPEVLKWVVIVGAVGETSKFVERRIWPFQAGKVARDVPVPASVNGVVAVFMPSTIIVFVTFAVIFIPVAGPII